MRTSKANLQISQPSTIYSNTTIVNWLKCWNRYKRTKSSCKEKGARCKRTAINTISAYRWTLVIVLVCQWTGRRWRNTLSRWSWKAAGCTRRGRLLKRTIFYWTGRREMLKTTGSQEKDMVSEIQEKDMATGIQEKDMLTGIQEKGMVRLISSGKSISENQWYQDSDWWTGHQNSQESHILQWTRRWRSWQRNWAKHNCCYRTSRK